MSAYDLRRTRGLGSPTPLPMPPFTTDEHGRTSARPIPVLTVPGWRPTGPVSDGTPKGELLAALPESWCWTHLPARRDYLLEHTSGVSLHIGAHFADTVSAADALLLATSMAAAVRTPSKQES